MFISIDGGILPHRYTKYNAGFDVYSNQDIAIGSGETKVVNLGIALDDLWMDQKQEFYKEQFYLALHIRSSLRAKGLTSLGTGIIDMDFIYPNEIKMVINNPSFGDYIVKKGDKIGQLILCRHEGWLLTSEYTKDEERTGGFGSTD